MTVKVFTSFFRRTSLSEAKKIWIASWIFSRACCLVRPWLQQPRNSGQWTAYPRSVFSTTAWKVYLTRIRVLEAHRHLLARLVLLEIEEVLVELVPFDLLKQSLLDEETL